MIFNIVAFDKCRLRRACAASFYDAVRSSFSFDKKDIQMLKFNDKLGIYMVFQDTIFNLSINKCDRFKEF